MTFMGLIDPDLGYIGPGTSGEIDTIASVKDLEPDRYAWASDRFYNRLLPIAGHRLAKKFAHARFDESDPRRAMGVRMLVLEMFYSGLNNNCIATVTDIEEHRKKRQRFAA